MRSSKYIVDRIKFFEGLHDGDLSLIGLQPKLDPIGIWTEGWGYAIRDDKGNFIRGKENKALALKFSRIKTEKEADERLIIDLEPRERLVISKIKVPLTQNQFDALVSHVYNTGGSDTLFNLINKKAGEESIRKFWETKYITAGGKKLQGLVKRRKEEADLFFK